MKHTIVAILALLIGAYANPADAFRVIEELEGSVELGLPDLTLPVDETGTVQYRACATCSLMTHTVSGETVYRLNGQPLPLADFLIAIEDIRSTPSVENRAMAAVFYDLNTKRATRVIVHLSRAR
jgi:hypothetical protein